MVEGKKIMGRPVFRFEDASEYLHSQRLHKLGKRNTIIRVPGLSHKYWWDGMWLG